MLKKKIFIIVILVLIVVLVIIGGRKILEGHFNSVLKVGDCSTKLNEKRCIIYLKDNIKLEKTDNDTYYLNDKKIPYENTECEIKAQMDANNVLLECASTTSNYYVYNAKSELILDLTKEENGFMVDNVTYQNKELIVTKQKFITDYEAALCQESANSIVYKKEKLKLKNNNFQTEIIESKRRDEIINNLYHMSCNELKTTNDPTLFYEKKLANGEA